MYVDLEKNELEQHKFYIENNPHPPPLKLITESVPKSHPLLGVSGVVHFWEGLSVRGGVFVAGGGLTSLPLSPPPSRLMELFL